MLERTKIRTATINGKVVEMMWDNASSLDFGKELGIEKVNDIQKELMRVITELQPNEAGEVKVTSIETMTLMVWVSILTAAETKDLKPSVTKREVKNALFGEDGQGMMEALVECLVQFSPIEREEAEALGK